MTYKKVSKKLPSIDERLREAKKDPAATKAGMFLLHNGVVRQTPKAMVRQGVDDGSRVKGMEFSYDKEKVDGAIKETYKMILLDFLFPNGCITFFRKGYYRLVLSPSGS